MHAPVIASGMLLLSLGALLLADRTRGRTALLPVLAVALTFFLVFLELARNDHGHADVLLSIGWIGAPIVLIFAGALWGSRRFYGYPDIGPHPGRLALIAAGVVLGVFAGRSVWQADVVESQRRAGEVRQALLGWRDAHGGQWPAHLEEAVAAPPRTRMGLLAPPAFRYETDGDHASLSFPIGADRSLELDLAGGTWRTIEPGSR